MDVSSFASKINLASLKTQADKIDIDLAKLSNVVENIVLKKSKYNKLVVKVDNILYYKFCFKN